MDVIGIGLANMDLVAHVKEPFLTRHAILKAYAKKLDDLSFGRLRADLPNFDAIPGGCVANTLCGLSANGVSTRFFGKIGNDSFESLYRASFRDYMVAFETEAGSQDSSQCAVLVTPDGERSFAYTHGASWDLAPSDIDVEALARAVLIYAEVYLFEFGTDSQTAKLIFETARKHKIPLVMKVMDQDFAVRYRQKIEALAAAGILTMVVGNHDNMPPLAGTATWKEALEVFKTWPCDVVMTANKAGAYCIRKGEVHYHPAEIVEAPKNTTGAGDQFMAGFLAGFLDHRPVADCLARGAASAHSILMHDTARPPLTSRHSISF